MKKILFISLTLFILFLTAGCNKTYSTDITFTDNFEQDTMTDITYKFTGKSAHFGFETGKVYYTDLDRQILITNFKQIKEVSKIDEFEISVYFNNKFWAKSSWSKENSQSFEDYIKKTALAETGITCEIPNPCESSSFTETTKDTFKDTIKIEIKYCYKDNCKNETVTLYYID